MLNYIRDFFQLLAGRRKIAPRRWMNEEERRYWEAYREIETGRQADGSLDLGAGPGITPKKERTTISRRGAILLSVLFSVLIWGAFFYLLFHKR